MDTNTEEDINTIKQSISSIMTILERISILQTADHLTLIEHDKILVKGNGVPSLQETVRVLTKNVSELIDDFRISQKLQIERDASGAKACWSEQVTIQNLTNTVNIWVDDVKIERARRNKEEALEKERKRSELTKWKWAGVGFAITTLPPLIWKLIVFWIQTFNL
jgi:hypothetical protein